MIVQINDECLLEVVPHPEEVIEVPPMLIAIMMGRLESCREIDTPVLAGNAKKK